MSDTKPDGPQLALTAEEQRVASLLKEHYGTPEDDPCFACDLEGYVAGRLDDGGRRAVEEHLAGCETCREALPVVEELHREGALEMAPFAPVSEGAEVVRLDEARARRTSSSDPAVAERRPRAARWSWLTAAAAILVAAVTVSVVGTSSDTLIAKGDGAVGSSASMGVAPDRLHLGVLRDGVTFQASSGDRLTPGDLVRFFYSAKTAGYVAVFHLATDRRVDALFPGPGAAPAAVTAGQDVPLDSAVTIERGDTCEWVVGVFSDGPLDSAAVAAALERLTVVEPSACTAVVRVPGARTVSVLAVRQ